MFNEGDRLLEIEELIGYPELDIHVVYTEKTKMKRGTRFIGRASIQDGKYTIFLTPTYFKMIDVQAREVLYHELAHIVAHSIDGTMDHNATWRQVMKQFGYESPANQMVPLCF